MGDLWKTEAPETWQESLDTASDRIKSLGKEKLVDLDDWFFNVLPESIRERNVASLEQPELVRLVSSVIIALAC
jgi:hypothetical protein